MATDRIEIKVAEEIKTKGKKASALLGMKSLTEYIVSLIEKDAPKVIARHESITVKNDIFDRFMEACEKARKPNKALRDALVYTKEQGIK